MSERRSFLASLAGFFAMPQILKGPKRVWVITTPRDILRKEPIIVSATSRIDAVVNLGMTVWTEEEWMEAQKLQSLEREAKPHP